MTKELTAKQQRFVEEYLLDLNATQAAIRAGYSAKTAYSIGEENLKKPEIQAAIDRRKSARSQKTQIDNEWVLQRLAEEADADLADIYQENGALKPIHDWPKIWRQGLVAGVEHVEVKDSEGNATGDFIVKVKLSERLKRVELIGKHVRVNAFQDVVQHKGLEGLADRLARAKQRKKGE